MPKGGWFKLYDDQLDDPKVARLTDFEFRVWHVCLCFCNRSPYRERERGYLYHSKGFPVEPLDIAQALHRPLEEVEAALARLQEVAGESSLLTSENGSTGRVLRIRAWRRRQSGAFEQEYPETTQPHRHVNAGAASLDGDAIPRNYPPANPENTQEIPVQDVRRKDVRRKDRDIGPSLRSGPRAKPVVSARPQQDWQAELQAIIDSTAYREQYQALVDLLAAENKGGSVAASRVMRVLLSPLWQEEQRCRGDPSLEAAFGYGLEAAAGAGVPNPNYVKKAAASRAKGPLREVRRSHAGARDKDWNET